MLSGTSRVMLGFLSLTRGRVRATEDHSRTLHLQGLVVEHPGGGIVLGTTLHDDAGLVEDSHLDGLA